MLAFHRTEGDNRVLCVFNLTDEARLSGIAPTRPARNLLSREGRVYPSGDEIQLSPYEALWLLDADS